MRYNQGQIKNPISLAKNIAGTMPDHLPLQNATFAVATLGCKVNQADSEAIGDQMSAAGFVQRNFAEAADVYIVNTCTVTHLGDRSSRNMIAQVHRRHPDALLVVTGCYAELNPEAVAALPGVDEKAGEPVRVVLLAQRTVLLRRVQRRGHRAGPLLEALVERTAQQRRVVGKITAESAQ